MWMMTKAGFFSISLHKDKPGHIMIRARTEKHLRALAFMYPKEVEDQDIVLTSEGDYHWRVTITQEAFSVLLGHVSEEVDYTNFKATVKEKHYKQFLLYCWQAGHGLQYHAEKDNPGAEEHCD